MRSTTDTDRIRLLPARKQHQSRKDDRVGISTNDSFKLIFIDAGLLRWAFSHINRTINNPSNAEQSGVPNWRTDCTDELFKFNAVQEDNTIIIILHFESSAVYHTDQQHWTGRQINVRLRCAINSHLLTLRSEDDDVHLFEAAGKETGNRLEEETTDKTGKRTLFARSKSLWIIARALSSATKERIDSWTRRDDWKINQTRKTQNHLDFFRRILCTLRLEIFTSW